MNVLYVSVFQGNMFDSTYTDIYLSIGSGVRGVSALYEQRIENISINKKTNGMRINYEVHSARLAMDGYHSIKAQCHPFNEIVLGHADISAEEG